MSVALVTMDTLYGLKSSKLDLDVQHHSHLSPNPHLLQPYHHYQHHYRHHLHSPALLNRNHNSSEDDHQDDVDEEQVPLRFSVVNILRPDFGREAILNTKTTEKLDKNNLTVNGQLSSSSSSSTSTSPSSTFHHSSLTLSHSSNHSTRITLTPQPVVTPITTSVTTPTSYSIQRDRESFSDSISPLQRHSTGLSRSGSLESLASNRSSITSSSLVGTPSLSSAVSTIGSESVSGDSITSSTSTTSTTSQTNSLTSSTLPNGSSNGQTLWPAWVYCTRYSDRPSSGPRTRRIKRTPSKPSDKNTSEEKRPRTAFSGEQLARLKREFTENRYLTERRRQQLSRDLGLNEAQIKIWFQNKRAKIKKSTGHKNPLALQLMAQGLYNHSTVPLDEDGEEILQNNDD